MCLVVDACYGGGVMQHKAGLIAPALVKGGASMKRILLWMKGLVVTALATLVLSGCGGDIGSTEQQQSPSEPTQHTSGGERYSAANLKELDTTIAGIMNDKNLPGVLVAVSVPGEGEYLTAQGKANLDTGRAPDLDDQFRIGSVTKTFVATAILQLVDEGKLNKSDTLSKWYPDFPNADRITIDDLLRMRSGIPDYWDEEALKQLYDNPLEQMTNEDVIEAAASKADQFEPPDQETKYNNTNYNILAAIVEKVSGNDINTKSAKTSSNRWVCKTPSTRPTSSYPASCTATA